MRRIQEASRLAVILGFVLIRLPVALFFGFVGYNKAFASLADLARYGSWTVHIPELLGRVAGVSEMVCAVLLIFPRWSRPKHARAVALGAGILTVNQLVAAIVHAVHGENGALPQNGILLALLLFITWASLRFSSQATENSGEE